MKRLVIAVDCDDVLVRSTPFFIKAYNRTYGTNVVVEKPEHYSNSLHWGVDRDIFDARLGELMRTDEYKTLRPSEDEVSVLTKLSKHHELHVVTARPPTERQHTQEMLDKYLPGVFTSLELVGFHGSKGEVAKRIHADVMIDDSLNHLESAIEQGLPLGGALLFGDYAWSAKDIPKGMVRCFSWKEVEREIERLAK